MIIEIRKAGFVNKGAELMLHAAIQQIRARYPDAVITMAPSYGGSSDTFAKMQKLGLFPKLWLTRYRTQWGGLGKYLPRNIRSIYGLILDHEVDVVLDAAGFSYSDQWGVGNNRELYKSSRVWNKNGAKVILLPQALGPFQAKGAVSYVRGWVDNVDLIYAREQDSYENLVSIVGQKEKIRVCPDFTNLVAGELPDDFDTDSLKVALVPNYRMIDKTEKEQSAAYIPFMISCAKYLISKDARPFILVHEGTRDELLAKEISDAAGGVPIIRETDPLKIKGILGSCDATIGSRFHGLVSALSQGVPSLATGWSHKYHHLFQDYGFEEGVVSVLDSKEKLEENIDAIIGGPKAVDIKNRLNERSKELKMMSETMWRQVFDEIDKI